MADSIKVMIVDDHVLIRDGIKKILECDTDLNVIAEAGSGRECLEKIDFFSPNILLLDISIPEMNGIEILQKIKEDKTNIKVLIVTAHDEIDYLIKAVDLGVDGYIMKTVESSELFKAIYVVLSGKKYIQPNLIPALNSRLANRDLKKEKIKSLTRREKEILIQVVNGMSNKEVALNFGISERTVKNHISSIFKKIEVSDRTQAAVFAIKNNIVRL